MPETDTYDLGLDTLPPWTPPKRETDDPALKAHLEQYDPDPISQGIAETRYYSRLAEAAKAKRRSHEEAIAAEYDDPIAAGIAITRHATRERLRSDIAERQQALDAPEQQRRLDAYAASHNLTGNAFIDEPYAALTRAGGTGLSLAARAAELVAPTGLPIGKQAADEVNRTVEELGQAQDINRQNDWSPWLSKMYGGASQNAIEMLATPGQEYAKIAGSVLSTANKAITEGHDAGLRGHALLRHAATQGGLEGLLATILQAKGMGGAESVFAGKEIAAQSWRQFGKQILKGYRDEALEEVPTEWAQNLASYLEGVQPGMSKTEILASTRDVLAQTGIMMGIGNVPHAAHVASLPKYARQEANRAERGEFPDRSKWKVYSARTPQEALKSIKADFGDSAFVLGERRDRVPGKGTVVTITAAPMKTADATVQSDASQLKSNFSMDVPAGTPETDGSQGGEIQPSVITPPGSVVPSPPAPVLSQAQIGGDPNAEEVANAQRQAAEGNQRLLDQSTNQGGQSPLPTGARTLPASDGLQDATSLSEEQRRIADAAGGQDASTSTAAASTGKSLNQIGTNQFWGTGGVSMNARHKGFTSAFRDDETGKVYETGTLHLFDSLPDEVVTERDAEDGYPTKIKPSMEAGFVKDGKFYTRDEASQAIGHNVPYPDRSVKAAPTQPAAPTPSAVPSSSAAASVSSNQADNGIEQGTTNASSQGNEPQGSIAEHQNRNEGGKTTETGNRNSPVVGGEVQPQEVTPLDYFKKQLSSESDEKLATRQAAMSKSPGDFQPDNIAAVNAEIASRTDTAHETPTPPKYADTTAKEIEAARQHVKDVIKKMRGRANSVTNLAELVDAMTELATAYVRHGVASVGDFINEMIDQLGADYDEAQHLPAIHQAWDAAENMHVNKAKAEKSPVTEKPANNDEAKAKQAAEKTVADEAKKLDKELEPKTEAESTETPKAVPAEWTAAELATLTYAAVDAERQVRGLPPTVKLPETSWQQTTQKAVAAMRADKDLVEKVHAKVALRSGISEIDAAVLLINKMMNEQKLAAAQSQLNKMSLSDVEGRLAANLLVEKIAETIAADEQLAREAGSTAGKTLNYFAAWINAANSPQSIKNKWTKIRKRELTPAENAEADALGNANIAAKKAEQENSRQEATKKAIEKVVGGKAGKVEKNKERQAANAVKKEVKRQKPSAIKLKAEAAVEESAKKRSEFAKKWFGRSHDVSELLTPEFLSDLTGIIVADVKAGVLRFAAFVDNLRSSGMDEEDLRKVLPTVAKTWNEQRAKQPGMDEATAEGISTLDQKFQEWVRRARANDVGSFEEFAEQAKKDLGPAAYNANEQALRAAWDAVAADSKIASHADDLDEALSHLKYTEAEDGTKTVTPSSLRRVAKELARLEWAARTAEERGWQDILDGVEKALLTVPGLESLSRDDVMAAISGIGVHSVLSTQQIDKEMRRLKAILLKVGQITNLATKGQNPPTGPQFDSELDHDPEIRNLNRQLAEAKQEFGANEDLVDFLQQGTYVTKELFATAARAKFGKNLGDTQIDLAWQSGIKSRERLQTWTDTIITRLEDILADLKSEVASGEPIIRKKRDQPTTSRIEQLKAEIEEWRNKRDALFAPERLRQREEEAEQRAEKAEAAVLRAKKDLAADDAALRAKKDIAAREKAKKSSVRLEKAEQRRKEHVSALAKLRRDYAKSLVTGGEARAKEAKRAADAKTKQADALQKQIDSGELKEGPVQGPNAPLSGAEIYAQARLNALRQHIEALREPERMAQREVDAEAEADKAEADLQAALRDAEKEAADHRAAKTAAEKAAAETRSKKTNDRIRVAQERVKKADATLAEVRRGTFVEREAAINRRADKIQEDIKHGKYGQPKHSKLTDFFKGAPSSYVAAENRLKDLRKQAHDLGEAQRILDEEIKAEEAARQAEQDVADNVPAKDKKPNKERTARYKAAKLAEKRANALKRKLRDSQKVPISDAELEATRQKRGQAAEEKRLLARIRNGLAELTFMNAENARTKKEPKPKIVPTERAVALRQESEKIDAKIAEKTEEIRLEERRGLERALDEVKLWHQISRQLKLAWDNSVHGNQLLLVLLGQPTKAPALTMAGLRALFSPGGFTAGVLAFENRANFKNGLYARFKKLQIDPHRDVTEDEGAKLRLGWRNYLAGIAAGATVGGLSKATKYGAIGTFLGGLGPAGAIVGGVGGATIGAINAATMKHQNRSLSLQMAMARANLVDALVAFEADEHGHVSDASLAMIENFVMQVTGKGLSDPNAAGKIANAAMLTASYTASRWALSTAQPLWYTPLQSTAELEPGESRLKPGLRAQFLKHMVIKPALGYAACVAAATLWNFFNDDDDDRDKPSWVTDYKAKNVGALRFGKTYIDLLGSVLGTWRFGKEMFLGGAIDPGTGSFRKEDRLAIAWRYGRGRLNVPAASLADVGNALVRYNDTGEARHISGEQVTPSTTVRNLAASYFPISPDQYIDALTQAGLPNKFARFIASVEGLKNETTEKTPFGKPFGPHVEGDHELYKFILKWNNTHTENKRGENDPNDPIIIPALDMVDDKTGVRITGDVRKQYEANAGLYAMKNLYAKQKALREARADDSLTKPMIEDALKAGRKTAKEEALKAMKSMP